MLLNKFATKTFGRVLLITVLVLSIGLLTACGGQSANTTSGATSYHCPNRDGAA